MPIALTSDADGPTIVLANGEADEWAALAELARTLGEAPKRRASISGLPFVESPDQTRLQATSRAEATGVTAKEAERSYRWTLTTDEWNEVARQLVDGAETLYDGIGAVRRAT